MPGTRLPRRPFLDGPSSQLAHPYRTMILRAMETVVSNHISKLDKDMARAAVLLASGEMTKAKVCRVAAKPLPGRRTRRGSASLAGLSIPMHADAGLGLAASGSGPCSCTLSALLGGAGHPITSEAETGAERKRLSSPSECRVPVPAALCLGVGARLNVGFFSHSVLLRPQVEWTP